MTQFKHIIVLVLMLSVSLLTAKAQSTALNPYEGATHTYLWSGLQEGVGYQFYVAADANGSVIYDDGTTGEFDFLGSASGTVGTGESTAAAQIAWNNGASTHTYYVWLKVIGTSGCSNYRYIQVTPQVNDFDILSQNNPETNTRSCPSINPTDGFNALASAYDAGSTTLEFMVKKENGSHNWSFIPNLSQNSGLPLGEYIISIAGTNSGTITPVGGRYTVLASDNDVLVTINIKNAPGYSVDVTLQVTGQREEQTNVPDGDPSNDSATHTLDVIPVIGGMGGV